MILADIEQQSMAGMKSLHGFELKTGNFSDDPVPVALTFSFDERLTQVPADKSLEAAPFENPADQGGNRRFAVGPRDCHQGRIERTGSNLNLSPYRDSRFNRCGYGGLGQGDAGADHDQVGIFEFGRVVPSQIESHSGLPHGLHLGDAGFIPAIGESHTGSLAQEKSQQRQPRFAAPHDQDIFSPVLLHVSTSTSVSKARPEQG